MPRWTYLDDAAFDAAAQNHTIFARISPEQKARLMVSARRTGRSVGFLGDGVNDALALHAADVGISVDTAADVAKDAADVVLLEKDLGVLGAGVAEGRRIFANTIKYVLMGTSSNFGNMFSAAAASAVLTFLPMLPSQILLNNLLYDSSQLAIPTDNVDAEQLHAPSHWNIAFIRRFMLTFGPISSLFDFLTFGLMLGVLHAGPVEFRTGWFVESLATQTLIIFAIRTRRVPFFRSRPGIVLTLATFAVIAVGIVLTVSPLAHKLGFTTLPWQFYTALVRVVGGLPGAGRADQESVLRRPDTPGRTATAHPRPRAPHPPPRRTLQPRRQDRPRRGRLAAGLFSSVVTADFARRATFLAPVRPGSSAQPPLGARATIRRMLRADNHVHSPGTPGWMPRWRTPAAAPSRSACPPSHSSSTSTSTEWGALSASQNDAAAGLAPTWIQPRLPTMTSHLSRHECRATITGTRAD